MAAYTSRNYWRVRFLASQGPVYALRNLQFRRFSGADPTSPCGSVEECREGVEAMLLYSEQAEGTRAADLFLYGSFEFDPGWSSIERPPEEEGGPPPPAPAGIFVGRHYPQGRDVAYIGLIATSGDAADTQISKFAVDWSDDGETWTEVREFNTNPIWKSGEERVFALPNADSYLPVFSFRPNRKEPMGERLSFLTDVLRGARGAEQRRSLRPTPRRVVEADFLLTGRERTFWDLFFNRLSGGEMTIPLYWDVVTLGAALNAGSTSRINFSTVDREWQYSESHLALLAGKTALDGETVQIMSVDANGITLTEPVKRPWPKGSKLYLLRRGVIEDVGEPSHKSAGVATVSAQLRFTVANPWDPAADTAPVYEGLPLFLDEPNWVDDLTVEYARGIAVMDATTGLPYQLDTMGRAMIGQAHRWFLTGRSRLARFRDLIYRHRGRAGSFWLPTFKADLKVVAPVAASATQLVVENVGYGYTGGPTSGRQYIAIKHAGGTIPRRIVSVMPGVTSETERLGLDAPVGLDLSPGQVRRISFMDVARFDADEFEIVHHGGIDGHHSASATFRTFRNTRTAPLPISAPIPHGTKTAMSCGQWTNRAISFVIDRSASMDSNNRLAVMKQAMSEVLDALAPYTSGFIMDLNAVSWSGSYSSITRRSVSVDGINDLKNWINDITTDGGGTHFDAGMTGAKAFFDNTDPTITRRFIFFISDGEATGDSATEARNILLSMNPVPQSRGVSMDSVGGVASLQLIDNTGLEIPIVSSGNYRELVDAVLGSF